MPRVILAAAAETDVAEIWAYIAEDNPGAADRLLDRFDGVFHVLASQPMLGKSVAEVAPDLRFLPTGAYLVFYRPLEDGVEIARVLHGARDITAEFFRD